MPSRNTLIWVGAAALAVVVAGAGAVVWTHPDFLEPNPADIPRVASAPAESKPPIVPPAAPAVPAAPPRKRSGACRQGPDPNRAARARLRHRERRSLGRSGHRRPRGAERESRAARRRQDRRRGDRRRLGPVCHHPAGARAGRSQPLLGRERRQGAAGDIEPGRGLGSCAGSQDGRRGRPARSETHCGGRHPGEPQRPTVCTRDADPGDAGARQRRPRRDPIGRGRRRPAALSPKVRPSPTPRCVSISIRRTSPRPRRNPTADGL